MAVNRIIGTLVTALLNIYMTTPCQITASLVILIARRHHLSVWHMYPPSILNPMDRHHLVNISGEDAEHHPIAPIYIILSS
jgi:hypothetical protein